MTSPAYDALPYRPNVGIMLLNQERSIFAAQRIDAIAVGKEAWQMPQGGVDKGEDLEAAAFRELEEEIGTANARVLGVTSHWLTYDLPQDLIGKALGGKYRGQKQKWFAMEFLGSDSEINIDTTEPEFHSWAWRKPEILARDIVAFKKEIYIKVFEEFKELLKP